MVKTINQSIHDIYWVQSKLNNAAWHPSNLKLSNCNYNGNIEESQF